MHQSTLAVQLFVGEANEGTMGVAMGSHAENLLNSVGFTAFAEPRGKADQGDGGRTAAATGAVNQKNSGQ